MTFNSISQKDKVSLPHSPPSSASVYREVSATCGCRDSYDVSPCKLGHPSPPAPTGVLTRHALVPGWGITMCSPRPWSLPLPPLVNFMRVPRSVQVLSTAKLQLHTSYATKSISADSHATSKLRGTRRRLSLKDVELQFFTVLCTAAQPRQILPSEELHEDRKLITAVLNKVIWKITWKSGGGLKSNGIKQIIHVIRL